MLTKKQGLPFVAFNTVLMLAVVCVTLYPFLYILALSLSDKSAVIAGKVSLFPVGFNLTAYKNLFQSAAFLQGYRNTLVYTAVFTLLSLTMTTLCAYPLAKRGLKGRGYFMGFFVFTMFFGGGLIPGYIVTKTLLGLNNLWVIVIPGCISVYNMIIMRTFFMGIPVALEEAAEIDGYNPLQILLHIVLPLSKPIIATMALFYALGMWNEWFTHMLYLNENDRYPVSMFLRNIVNGAELAVRSGDSTLIQEAAQSAAVPTVRSATIMVVTLPVLMIYPFIQKYFTQGVMIGSIKE